MSLPDKVRDQMMDLATSMRELDPEEDTGYRSQETGDPNPGPRVANPELPTTQRPSDPTTLPGLHPFEGKWPVLGPRCFLAPGAVVIGDVHLGEDCSVWSGAVLRGDVNTISVGPRCNIQDGSVLHSNPGDQVCRLGTGVTVGHQATVHACEVGDYALIGIHAVVLDGARIGERSMIGAGAVVTPGTEIPPRSLALGIPARVLRELTPEELETLEHRADEYVGIKNRYLAGRRTSESASDSELPRYECLRTTEPVIVDGHLGDRAWRDLAPLVSLRGAVDGAAPSLRTQFQACWDDRCLYLAFHCQDTDVWSTMIQRDQPLYNEEVVEAFLCPTGDLAHYFEIEVNPRNTVFDGRVFSPEHHRKTMLVDTEWDAIGLWTATAVSGTLNSRDDTDTGWSVEIAVPFTAVGLSGPPEPGTVWRCNFYRIERGKVSEFSAWSPTLADPPDFHLPERFGELVFVSD